jgi:hypothetical protein
MFMFRTATNIFRKKFNCNSSENERLIFPVSKTFIRGSSRYIHLERQSTKDWRSIYAATWHFFLLWSVRLLLWILLSIRFLKLQKKLNPNAEPGVNADSISAKEHQISQVWPWGFPGTLVRQCIYLQQSVLFKLFWNGMHLLDKFPDGDAQYFLKNEPGDPDTRLLPNICRRMLRDAISREHLQEDFSVVGLNYSC